MSTRGGKSNQERTSRWTRKDLMDWSPLKRLSRENQDLIVQKCRESNWPQSGAINLPNLLTNLLANDQVDIKRVFCAEFIKQVS